MRRFLLAALTLLLSHQSVGAQLSYSTGQNISPGYEGWEQNEDSFSPSCSLLFSLVFMVFVSLLFARRLCNESDFLHQPTATNVLPLG